MLEHYMEAVSTYASSIDNLINAIGITVGFWFFATQGVFFWFMWKFRKREGVKSLYITGEEASQMKWIHIPHNMILVLDIGVIVWAIAVWVDVKQDIPEPRADQKAVEIRVTGQQWSWTFQTPGPDGQLDTEDDIRMADELHIEQGALYTFHLDARDVMHSFSIPVFRLKQDAVPGREITGWFEATATGEHDIQCAEMCGIGHGIMKARIFIETPEQHAQWVADNSRGTSVAAGFNTPATGTTLTSAINR